MRTKSALPSRHHATLAALDENQETLEILAPAERVRMHLLEGLRAVMTSAVKYAKRLLHRLVSLDREAVALQADLVDRTRDRRVAVGDDVWRDVLHDLRHCSDHRIRPDATELM